jgi:hypothetical protein
MNHRILVLAACAIALSAQSVNFTISNPGHVLTATKSDPRAVEMFTVDLVDSKGNPKGEYIGIVENRIAPIMLMAEEQFRPPFPSWYKGLDLHVKDSKVCFVGDDNPIVSQRNADLTAGRTFDLWRTMAAQSVRPDASWQDCTISQESAQGYVDGQQVRSQTDTHGNQIANATAFSDGGEQSVSTIIQLHESCPAGLYTGWLQTAVGIDTGCPPGQTIYSGSAPAYNGSLILFLLSQGTITPNYGWQNPSMNWYVGASSPSFSGQSGGPCN